MAERKVIIDVKGALLALEHRTGEKISGRGLSKKFEISNTNIQNWRKNCPKSVQFVNNFIKEYGCTFEELVKEI